MTNHYFKSRDSDMANKKEYLYRPINRYSLFILGYCMSSNCLMKAVVFSFLTNSRRLTQLNFSRNILL